MERMLSEDMPDKYETIIGLEIHIELATATKIFCGCETSFGAAPNTHICPVCLGMPGALPVPNKKVVDHAIAVATALNCRINTEFRFDRKNYFYPDNPQNYQISQLYSPIGVDGYLTITCGDTKSYVQTEETAAIPSEKRIRIHEMHMEEDAGKLIHDEETSQTLIDYNRAGVPLIEIVTEPDMRSADEVDAFLKKLRGIIRYLGVSDCKMNEGSMRVDVNLSVRKRSEAEDISGKEQGKSVAESTYDGDALGLFGTRTEMKNLNSFKAISRAIETESKRQIALIESGRTVDQETRRWDDEKGTSFVMRSKEDRQDYRYFPDPDLPKLSVSDDRIRTIRESMPELPEEKAERYKKEYCLPDYDIEILTEEKILAELFEKTVEYGADPKKVSNWIMGETMRIMNDEGMDPEDITIDPKDLSDLIELTDNNVINSTTAKEIFAVIFKEKTDVKKYVDEHGMAMLSNTSELEGIIKNIINNNPKSVVDYNAGKTKAIGFLIGQVMKETKGKADPELVKGLLIKEL